ncbi:uncharacterized protein LOC114750162 [Neltuma alba]|uniref:uncharacterized protein LOC114750162 n=1 Tax=Neltuma alba TaxID=207710 RepID=UPI0010A40CF6|nr:uncharacterized protein LOC114750162 [Prosopis alba]
MPHGLLERYNRKMETPDDIFRESHKELMKSEGKWASKTSQACSVVSTLVASVAFATRTSLPGSYDAYKGYAILRNKAVFKIFAVSSLLAFLFSLISTICFLSVAASRSQSVRSWRYVPCKLYFGMYFMFVSIVCLWVSFCAADFFALNDDGRKLDNALPSYIFLSLGIILLVVTQLPTFLGPTLSSIWPIPAPRRKATRPMEYQRTNLNH